MTSASAGAERGWVLRAAIRAGLLAVIAGFLAYMLLIFPGAAAASDVDRDSAEGARLAGTLIPIAVASIAAALVLGVWLTLDVARAISLSFRRAVSRGERMRLRASLPWVAALAVLVAVGCATLSVAVIVDSIVAGIGVDADQTKYWGSTGAIIGDAFGAACIPFVVATGVALVTWTIRAATKLDRHAKHAGSSVAA
ncbi:uncharacterized membrane protein YjgN (DUF898 family) [Pseudoclavibacter sp. JAI123]|uniref:hypothetical protein n=1 Tax=Pseudoclavibacter sp. JAI123 TaxID=2723065 RepID=UPI0015CE28EB|nr:hypothetical protein [Pseudoclavibacter sp. JAI123]NYF12338.1 uncharacterized membrane protein YjgN (DUF898 family) [Pseudoclavibacter sp. JAI123]